MGREETCGIVSFIYIQVQGGPYGYGNGLSFVYIKLGFLFNDNKQNSQQKKPF